MQISKQGGKGTKYGMNIWDLVQVMSYDGSTGAAASWLPRDQSLVGSSYDMDLGANGKGGVFKLVGWYQGMKDMKDYLATWLVS